MTSPTSSAPAAPLRVCITGAAGYVGTLLAAQLAARPGVTVSGVDLRPRQGGAVPVRAMDIRDPALAVLLRDQRIDAVVHLAAVLEPTRDRARDFDIDVNGTRNVIAACVTAGVRHLTVTSSGAAYGYHADNPVPLTEEHPLRGDAARLPARAARLQREVLRAGPAALAAGRRVLYITGIEERPWTRQT
ncbi:MAG: NAD-dependent epimerase/dehydratase family protein, partial [Betaproteobacteria bacterium]|nr:NAD-dependent epimerase/dehydratase family protein [Betaproteobacteria bacterium]